MKSIIRVTSVRGVYRPEDRAKICYVGRSFAGWPSSPFGNPFKHGTLDEVLAKYEEHLCSMPGLSERMASLWEACRHGELPLGCWCGEWEPGRPEIGCHAVIVAKALAAWVEVQRL